MGGILAHMICRPPHLLLVLVLHKGGVPLVAFHFFVNIEQRLGLPELAARWGA